MGILEFEELVAVLAGVSSAVKSSMFEQAFSKFRSFLLVSVNR